MMIVLQPDADGDCLKNLRAALEEAAGTDVSIDLQHVPYLTSTALTELIRFQRNYVKAHVTLVSPNALVTRTLQIVGFNKVFSIKAAA